MAKTTSKQPRFTEKEVDGIMVDLLSWAQDLEDAPPYRPDTRYRDTWLAEFWRKEPHLQGVIHSMVSIDANRGWTLTGGRNQVLRYTGVLHDWTVAWGLKGWRPGTAALSTAYHTSDFGGIAEIGRDGKSGPTRQFFHLDPTRCYLTSKEEFPISYVPKVGRSHKIIPYREMDMIRVASMPEIREEYRGAGWCFLSRAEILIRLMIAVWQHDLEALGAAAPRGILLILGISEKQWRDAMVGRKADREGANVRYYDAIQVLCGNGPNVDAKLIALSQLPANFNLRDFIAMFMYGLALIAGYDPSEFYPVQFGSLGRGTEMEVQHEKATGKGGRNFILAVQEQLQRPDVLPEALHFEYDERDEAAEIEAANVMQAWANVFKTMRETGMQLGVGGAITDQETRQLYAEKGMIAPEWVDTEIPSTSSDEDEAGTDEEAVTEARQLRIRRDMLLAQPHIWRAVRAFPDDALVRYQWPKDRVQVLWSSGSSLIKRVYQPAARIRRQDESAVLYEKGEVKITADMVTQAINQGIKRTGAEFGQLLDNEPITEGETI